MFVPSAPNPFFLSNELPVSYELTDTFGSAGNVTFPITYTARNIGTVFTGRYIIVHAGNYLNASFSITSLSVGGVALTKLAEWEVAIGAQYNSFWGGFVPTGTTANVVISGTSAGPVFFAIFSIKNLKSTTPVGSIGVGGGLTPFNINVKRGGILLVGRGGGSNVVSTFSGASLVKEYDNVYIGSFRYAGAAALTPNDATETLTMTGSPTGARTLALSMR